MRPFEKKITENQLSEDEKRMERKEKLDGEWSLLMAGAIKRRGEDAGI
jgi:hypothetical protein